MTSIQDFPQELLSKIFENLELYELFKARHVCSQWYNAAHILLLEDLGLQDIYAIKWFIATIDNNPDPTYLAAVKSIEIFTWRDEGQSANYYFDKESIERLFCRFPNLTYVHICSYAACLEEFTEELCQNILDNCPKLEHFMVSLEDKDPHVFCRGMYKVRLLVTTLHLDYVGSASRFGGVVKFIASFPRLRETLGRYHRIPKFKHYLPIFEQLSNLKSVNVEQKVWNICNERNFAEIYLARLSKEHQDLITKRISNVTDLTYITHVFCPNSLKFIAAYFTGLKKLRINFNCTYRNWATFYQQVALIDSMTNFAVEDQADITLSNIALLIVKDFLPDIVNKLFSQIPSNRVLQINVDSGFSRENKTDLRMQWPTSRRLNVSFGEWNGVTVHDIITDIFNRQVNNIDQFVFNIKEKDDFEDIRINTYNVVFKMIPLLKEATLDIPTSFVDSTAVEEFRRHTHMESLTLRPIYLAKFQSLLDTFALMFPNLKFLNLYFFSGEWVQRVPYVYYDLDNYSLECLVIDLTPVEPMMQALSIENDFFVIQVETPENTKLFKVSRSFSRAVRVHDEDYQDGFCVHILINSLQRLECCIYNMDDDHVEYGRFDVYQNDPRFNRLVIF